MNILKNCDAFEEIKNLPDQSIDLILTDPPYNVGKFSTGKIKVKGRKDFNNDVADWDQGTIDPVKMVGEFQRVLKPTGNIFIFSGPNDVHRWRLFLNQPTFDVLNEFFWIKTNPSPNFRKTSFLKGVEQIVCCWNKGHTWNFKKQVEMKNYFISPICMGKERKLWNHPTQKPLALLKHIIEIASNPGDVVLDCFMGVGSVPRAAKDLNRQYIGYELDKTYFDKAEERLKS